VQLRRPVEAASQGAAAVTELAHARALVRVLGSEPPAFSIGYEPAVDASQPATLSERDYRRRTRPRSRRGERVRRRIRRGTRLFTRTLQIF
jgi:hypothetical protein